MGLQVPETICTNDPKTALSFVEKCGGRAFFREFGIQPYLVAPAFVTSDDVRRKAKRIRHAPINLMQYIEKEFEVRAVVVGDKIFAARIDSQASPYEEARLDWRRNDHANVRWDKMKLPVALERKLLRMARALKLNFGSIDLIKGADGKYYYLEMNRPGNTVWLQWFVGLDIHAEVISYFKSALA